MFKHIKEKLLQYSSWQVSGMVQTYSSLAFLLILAPFLANISFAAQLTQTPREISPGDISYTSDQLTAAATSITIQPLNKYVNGVKTEGCFDTPAGFVMIQDFLGRTEWASYGTKACDSDNVTTISEMIRGLNPKTPGFGTGTGLAFDAGATIRVIDYTISFKTAVYTDLNNLYTGSGATKYSGSGSLAIPTFSTYDEMIRQLGSSTSDGVRAGCATDTLLCYKYIGGAWRSESGSNVTNATISVAGKVQLATTGSILAHDELGSTGAANVLSVALLTRTSTGSTQANKIPVLDANGLMTGSLLGTGTKDSTTFLRGDQTYQPITYLGTCADGEGVVGTGTTVTLTGDANYNNLTIYSGAVLDPAGYRIWVCDTLHLYDANGQDGRLASNGGNGSNGANAVNVSGGAGGGAGTIAYSAGTLPIPLAGKSGGAGGTGGDVAGTLGVAGGANSSSVCTAVTGGGAGGKGGVGNAAGGVGGGSGTVTITTSDIVFNSLLRPELYTARTYSCAAGSGGGGGGGSGSDGAGSRGGGGGGGGSASTGGNVDVYVNTLTGSGYIMANGGNGGNGGTGGVCGSGGTGDGGGGGGGGGGAGGGGTIVFVYKSKSSFTGSISTSAGNIGTGGTGGTTDCTTAGGTGVGGAIGSPGIIYQFKVN